MKSARTFPHSFLGFGAWIAVGTLLACTVTIDSEGETQNTALIDRLPAGATAIVWMDFEALERAMPPEKWDEYEEMFEGGDGVQDLQRFVEATGIDPREDVHQVAIAVMPGSAENDPLVMASVDYDEAQLLGFLANAETLEHEGTTIYAISELVREFDRDESDDVPNRSTDANATDNGYLAIMDQQTLAMGNEEGIRIVIDVEAGRRDALKGDPRMNELISDVAGSGQVWAVATRESWDDEVRELGDAGGMVPTGAIESIETVTMSLRMGDGMAIRLAGIAGNPEDANLLATTLNGWAAMGKMALQQSQPQLFEILDRGIKVGSSDRTIHIDANLTDADIEVLQQLAEEQMADTVIGSGF